MHVTLVHVQVRSEHVDAFIEATRVNHEASVLEPGNLRFDVLRSVDEPERFILYEAYIDAAAAADHKQTAHYAAWRRSVADWMAEPRVGVRYAGLFPEAGEGGGAGGDTSEGAPAAAEAVANPGATSAGPAPG